MTAERAVLLVKKVTYFGEVGYQFMYQEKYYFNVFEFLERYIYAFVAKLSDRCFCWFPAAMLVLVWMSTSKASPYISL